MNVTCAGTGFYELAFLEDCNKRRPDLVGIGNAVGEHGMPEVHESAGNSYSAFAIESVTASKQILTYAGDPTPYPFVAYKLKLKRYGNSFFQLGVIMPDLLLTFVSFVIFVPRIDSALGGNR